MNDSEEYSIVNFTDSEVDLIALHCEKLMPEARTNMETRERAMIMFPRHQLSFVKVLDRHQHPVMVLCEFDPNQDMDDPVGTVIGQWYTVEEAIFGILAVVTTRLPAHLANQLVYENQPVTYQ